MACPSPDGSGALSSSVPLTRHQEGYIGSQAGHNVPLDPALLPIVVGLLGGEALKEEKSDACKGGGGGGWASEGSGPDTASPPPL